MPLRIALIALFALSADARRVVASRQELTGESDVTAEELTQYGSQLKRFHELRAKIEDGQADANDEAELKALLGDVEYADDEAEHWESATQPAKPSEVIEHGAAKAVMGYVAKAGLKLSVIEAMTAVLGRMFTRRRDYAIEAPGEGVNASVERYIVEGETFSLHSRMYVYGNDRLNWEPKYQMRRAFSYLNVLARAYGQYVYRIIPHEKAGWGSTDHSTFTITKDRFGRGLGWLNEEWRIYSGTGGCGKYGSGLLSCDSHQQQYFAFSDGMTSGTWNTKVYKGNIKTMDPSGKSMTLYNGDVIGTKEMDKFLVATITQTGGQPRALRWLNIAALQVPGLNAIAQAGISFTNVLWKGAQEVEFKQDADELLMTAVSCLMDLTHDYSF